MLDTQVITLPMNEYQWKILGVQQEGASLFVPICRSQKEILDFMDGKKEVTLNEILNHVESPEPIVMMSLGGLIMEGIVDARRHNTYILFNKKI